MERLIKNLLDKPGQKLKAKNLSLVTAESCSGGGIAYAISIDPNTSALLERGYVTYSNQAKQDPLGVKTSTLLTCGAVSKEVAVEMAEGALKNSCAQISIATTGIAAFDNESENGIVWISCASVFKKTFFVKKIIKGKREKFCDKVIVEALAYID